MAVVSEVRVSRVIDAPIDRVFKAWTDPEEMKKWYAPVGYETPQASSDQRVGGKYSVQMKGEHTFNVGGEYLEFDSPHHISFTWNGHEGEPSTVSVDFKEVDGGKTEVTLVHTGIPTEESRLSHEQGWVGTFGKLEDVMKA